MAKQTNKKKNTTHSIAYIISVIVAVTMIGASYFLYQTVLGMNIFPQKYTDILMYVLIGLNVFFGLIAFIPGVNTLNKSLQILICGVLSAGLILVNIYIPNYLGQFERMFNLVPDEGTLLMSVYALTDSEYQSVSDLGSARIGVLEGKDAEYLEYSKKVISRELNGNTIETIPYDDVYSLAEDLLGGNIDAILMNETYARFISENSDFEGFNYKAKIIYTVSHKVQLKYETNDVGNITTDPFIIAVTGNDTWDYSSLDPSRNDSRSDVNMLLVVNPVTKKVLVVSLPRDTYVALWGDRSAMDKLTHATIYGIDVWEQTINNLLNIHINYFVKINFQSFVNVVNALGGIDIDNPYEFSMNLDYFNEKGQKVAAHYSYPKGIIHLDGNQALAYVRERHNLQGGDLDRTKHQALAVKGVIDKVTQVSIITKISDLLDAVNGTFYTDININKIYALVQMQLDDMASWEILSFAVTGDLDQRTSYAMGNGTTTKKVIVEVPVLDEDGQPVLDEDGNPITEEKEEEQVIQPSKYSVIIPNDQSIRDAMSIISQVMNGQ